MSSHNFFFLSDHAKRVAGGMTNVTCMYNVVHVVRMDI